jgi:hypothetical protein
MKWLPHGSPILRSIRIAALAGLCAFSVLGQVSAVRSGSFEVGPFAGASYGIDHFRVMAGGNVTYAFKNKYVLPYFEYSYFPGMPRTASSVNTNITNGITTATSFNGSYSVPLNDIHGGVHIRLPIFKESPVVPYLVYGMGVFAYGRTTENYTVTTSTPTGTTTNTGMSTVPGASDFTINAGGGLRYYLGGTGKFGFRVEAKVYKPVTGVFSNSTIGKVEAGFFFQLR